MDVLYHCISLYLYSGRFVVYKLFSYQIGRADNPQQVLIICIIQDH